MRMAEELGLAFEPNEFNFSPKWSIGFKKANGINRVRLHGEGADAYLVSVETVSKELPPLLADTSLHKIYNFDETGTYERGLLTFYFACCALYAYH